MRRPESRRRWVSRALRWAVHGVLLGTLLGGSLELHTPQHDPLSDVVAAEGAEHVVTAPHPERAAGCLEHSAPDPLPRCPACLLRLHTSGAHLLAPAWVARPAAAGAIGRTAGPAAPAAAVGPATSRGPPVLL